VWLLQEPTYSEELSASFITVTRIGELGTTIAVTSNRRTLLRNVPRSPILVTLIVAALNSSETSALTRATQRNIQEDDFLQVVNTFISIVFTETTCNNFQSISAAFHYKSEKPNSSGSQPTQDNL
jgi:hypothetical protein